jgi:hypothetical protein
MDEATYSREQRKEIRREGHLQRLGSPQPACVVCGYSKPEALTRVSRSLLERHHIAGLGDGPTVWLCRNHHAELSDRQRDWPRAAQDRERPDQAKLAALLRGLAEFLILLAHELIQWSQWLLGQGEAPV